MNINLWVILLVSMGCMSVKTQNRSSFLDEFEQSGSLCIDALTINLAKSNCLEVSHTEQSADKPVFYVQCVNTLDGYQDKTWNKWVFIIIENETDESINLLEQGRLLCVDSKTILGITQESTQKIQRVPRKHHVF